MIKAKDLIYYEQSQLGIKESPPNSNNVQYNTWWYGRQVSGNYPWCVVFQQYCCHEVGYDIPIRTASCTTLMNWAKKNGMWIDDPKALKPGDMFIMQGAESKHIGLIEVVIEPGQYFTLEGNTSLGSDSNGGEVMRRSRFYKREKILGAFRPPYEKEEKDLTEAETKALIDNAIKNSVGVRYEKLKDVNKFYKPTIEKLLKEGFLAGKGGSGDDTIIDLSEDTCRTFVILDRAGLL